MWHSLVLAAAVALALAGAAHAQGPSIQADNSGIVVSLMSNQQLFVEHLDSNGQLIGVREEVVLKSQLDAVNAQLSHLSAQYITIANQIANLASQSSVSAVSDELTITNDNIATVADNLDAVARRVTDIEQRTPSPSTSAPTPAPVNTRTAVPTPVPLNCQYGVSGDGTRCRAWRRIVTEDINDIVIDNVHVVVSLGDANDATSVVITGRPTDGGCGGTNSVGSSMGVYVRGQWTKIRYRQVFRGQTSCYAVFGASSYNHHEHTDSQDLDNSVTGESLSGSRLYLGSESGGLFELNTSIDTLSNPVGVSPQAMQKFNRQGGHQCDPQDHIWLVPNGQSRSITAELRRFYRVFEDGHKLYAEDAGPNVGVSCANVGTVSWDLDQIEVLE